MSSTPVRRTGPAARPRTKSAPTRTTMPAPALALTLESGRSYANAFERAFPIPRITVDRLTLAGFALVALIIRVWGLGDRALHHDESLHATYSWYLMGQAQPHYHYDPMMHGPLQFHMIGLFYSIFGSSPFAARMWSVAAGTALVLAPWLLYRQLGRWATYALMTIFCFSPILLYFSRFAREDMQFGLFTFLMVAALVRYVTDRQAGEAGYFRWIYLLAASFILAYAAKESIYLTGAVLAAFIAGQLSLELLRGAAWAGPAIGLCLMAVGLLGHLMPLAVVGVLIIAGVLLWHLWATERTGLVSDAIRGTPMRIWGFAVAIIAVLFTLFYWPIGDPVSWAFIPGANQVHTTLDIPGKAQPVPYTYSTDGFLGGLQYWNAQVPVARGGQPWYYYLFVIPLYEWLVVLFGIIGAVYVVARQRTFFTMLVLWWTVASFGIYAWASEKMPWNSTHLVIPLAVLAAIGLVQSVTHTRRWVRYLAIAAAVATGLVSLHNSFTLSYLNGANPVELMVYVQTSQDVPAVYNEVTRLQAHTNGPLHVVVDAEDEWPWVYYLRDSSRFATDKYPSTTKDYAGVNEPVLMVGGSNYSSLSSQFAGRYVAFHEVLRWWGPEEYKTYAERTYPYKTDAKGNVIPPSGQLLPRLNRLGYFLRDVFSPTTWANVLQWEFKRRPFTPTAWQGDSNQLIFYFLVRKDMVPYLSAGMRAQAAQLSKAQALADPFYTRTRILPATGTFGGGKGNVQLTSAGPLAADSHGDVYVVDANGSKVQEIAPNGTLVRNWGAPGKAAGQFQFQFQLGAAGGQTSGIAVAPAGNVYVSDTWNHRIQEFSPNGAFIRSWGKPNSNQNKPGPGEFYGPRGLAVAPNGNVYVADTGNKRIQVFDPDGRYLFSFGSSGSGVGQFNEPSSLAIDRSGHVYVADYWNQRIQIFDLQGHALGQFAINIWQAGSYDEPAIAVDGAGHLYVPDPAGARILVYTAAGQPYLTWGGVLNGNEQFSKPLSIAAGPGGKIFVSDAGTNQVLRFAAP